LNTLRAHEEEYYYRLLENKIQKARASFWEYEKLRFPGFFKDSRPHLNKIADALQKLDEGKLLKPDGTPFKKLMINMPPRFGKSFSTSNFCTWTFGNSPKRKIASVSYNEIMSGEFSRHVRDTIDETKAEAWRVIYPDIFPGIKIKAGDSAKGKWSLEGTYFSYLGTSFGGTFTGMGGNIIIIDDPIKNYEEALNEFVLEKHWEWYRNTCLQRLEEGGIIILVMTRWSTRDLCGRVLDLEGDDWYQLVVKAIDDKTGEMTCPELLSTASYIDKTKPGKMAPEIARANYHQEPVDIKGKLYKEFQTYDSTQKQTWEKIVSYCDTADEGDCYLCNVIFGIKKREPYLLDVYYTQEGMEVTEPETAHRLDRFNVKESIIESNNGGRGFGRNVKRILWNKHKNGNISIKMFHQGDNKEARIIGSSTYVMSHIYFPEDWAKRWPLYYQSMNSYQRTGKNRHTDAPDATTGVAEYMNRKFSDITQKKTYSKQQLGVL